MTTTAIDTGLALLDHNMPDWAERIDMEVFDIGSTGECIVGQLFPNEDGRFDLAVLDMWEAFGLDDHAENVDPYAWAQDMGFDQSVYASYGQLAELWEGAIGDRQEGLA